MRSLSRADLMTYPTLVKAHANHGRVIEAMGGLERMLNQGITPDAIIFNTVPHGLYGASHGGVGCPPCPRSAGTS